MAQLPATTVTEEQSKRLFHLLHQTCQDMNH